MPIRRTLAAALAATLVVGAFGCSDDEQPRGQPTTTTAPRFGAGVDDPPGPRTPTPELTVRAVSTRPEMVTGGDVLVEVEVPPDVDATDLRVTAGSVDVTDALTPVDDTFLGLVTDLPDGPTTITAELDDMADELEVVNHPTTGPLFSGPQRPLVACSTEAMGLGPATDASCSAPTVVDYRYITTGGAVVGLSDPGARPADLATAVIEGERVPLIVRRERGVLNRGIYTTTVVDPTPGQAPPEEPEEPTDPADPSDPSTPSTTTTAPPTTTTALPAAVPAAADTHGLAWNHRLVVRFGGGCGTGQTQGDDGAGAEVVGLLSRGYAVASSTFTTFQTHCNDVLAAETALMLKERVVESLGRATLTIGEGSSGGAIQQHLILQNYPGILDAAAAGSPFPDAASISPGVTDCGLLERYYATPTGQALNPVQQAVINGHGTDATCPTWVAGFLSALRPSEGCPAVPEELRYDSSIRRGGIRCTMVDNNVATLGVDPVSGFANRPLDNVGVQYGVNALNAGVITTDQFLDLNQSIGGYDVDGDFTASRTAASEAAIATAYAGGRVALGAGDLRVVPVIDVVVATGPGDIHDRFRAFSLRDRLRLPDGEPAPNHVIWTRRPTDPGLPPDRDTPFGADAMVQAVLALDEWATAAEADEADGNRAERVARNRPEDVADECLDAATGEPLRGDDVYSPGGACAAEFPIHGDPRTAAGEARRDDVLKCRTVPVDPTSYVHPMTPAQVDRLRAIFPAGVCDWSVQGIGQLDVEGAWLDYSHGVPFDSALLLERDRERGVTGREDPDADPVTGQGG
jgi:hypothetical protein